MQSTNITIYRRNGFFGVPIIGQSSSFAIKFDTGATRSVISKFDLSMYDMRKSMVSTDEILSLVIE